MGKAPPNKPEVPQKKTNIKELWNSYFHGRVIGNGAIYRSQLMEHYQPLVKYTAKRIHRRLPNNVELDDLISSGIFGLIDALESYNPERGVKFEIYAVPRIRGSILDELRGMDWVPRLVRSRSHQLSTAAHALESQLGRKPTEKEIRKELGMNKKEFGWFMRDSNATKLISLETTHNNDESQKDVHERDTIENEKSTDPFCEAQKNNLKELLTRGLTRAERLIVTLYYYEEMTMKEIATAIGISESRVSQMHTSIIARLKAQLSSRGLTSREEFYV